MNISAINKSISNIRDNFQPPKTRLHPNLPLFSMAATILCVETCPFGRPKSFLLAQSNVLRSIHTYISSSPHPSPIWRLNVMFNALPGNKIHISFPLNSFMAFFGSIMWNLKAKTFFSHCLIKLCYLWYFKVEHMSMMSF